MRRASDILHKPVIVGSSGDYAGRVTNLVFDEHRGLCLGAVVERGRLLRRTRVLPFVDIMSIGKHFVVARRRESLLRPRDMPAIVENPPSVKVKGKRLVSADGQYLGRIVDVRVDERSGRIEGYDLSRGRLATLFGKRMYLSAVEGLVASDDIVLAPAGAAASLQSVPPDEDDERLSSARA